MELLPIVASCFLFLSSSVSAADDCAPTWQQNRDSHSPTDLTNDPASLVYLAELLRNDELFEEQLVGDSLHPYVVAGAVVAAGDLVP